MHPDTLTADALIAELEQEGARGEAGEFTLSPEAARTKLRQYQLQDPQRYVLLLVQAASLRGARRLSFEFDTDDLRLVFDGQAFTRVELEGLHSALYTRCADAAQAALQELALACNAAEALAPRFIQIRSTTAAGTYELELRPGIPLAVRPAEPLGWPTRVQIHQGIGRTAHGAVRQLLSSACAYSATEIFVDRTRISRGMKLSGRLPQVPISGPALRGVAGWAAEGSPGPGALRLVVGGVWFTTQYPSFLLPGAIVVIEGDRLRKTLSQDAVVQDDALPPVHEAARAAQIAALQALVRSWLQGRKRPAPQAPTQALRLFRAALPQVVPPGCPLEALPAEEVTQTLLRTPVWRQYDGGRTHGRELSLVELWEHVRRGGVVGALDLERLLEEWRRLQEEASTGLGAYEFSDRALASPSISHALHSRYWCVVAGPRGGRPGPVWLLQDLQEAELGYLRALFAPATRG